MKSIVNGMLVAGVGDSVAPVAWPITFSSLWSMACDMALMRRAIQTHTPAQHLAQPLEGVQPRANARLRGLAHNDGFSWDRCTAQTLIAYRKTLESR